MDNILKAQPLSRQEVKDVIEGKGHAKRVPMAIHFWSNLAKFNAEQRKLFESVYAQYPYDITHISLKMPDVFILDENQSREDIETWVNKPMPKKIKALDAVHAIDLEEENLEDILANFPNPKHKRIYPENPPEDGRYRLGSWFYCLFERMWSLRGMENSLCDFYENPQEVHKLFRAFTDFYKELMSEAKIRYNLDGIFTSDDIGTQTGPFFSREIFETFFKPYYKELIEHAHSLDMHFWLHTCGCVFDYIGDFIEIGLDVLHPIQKYTMDEKEVANKFGKDICIWAGFDVQQIIPYGTPEDVRKEVRFMIDTYARESGRLIITAGNGLTPDTPLESLRALLDETLTYSTEKFA